MIGISLNGGSSSLKISVYNMNDMVLLGNCTVEKIGSKDSFVKFKVNSDYFKQEIFLKEHGSALQFSLSMLLQKIGNLYIKDVKIVAHRVVHGGEKYNNATLINKEVIKDIRNLSDLAPLHNPVNLKIIEYAIQILPEADQYAIFDTAYHQTIPLDNYMYSLPYEFYEKYKIRKYGFHGTSHEFIARKTSEILSVPLSDLNIVSAHIGNGASLCAIREGLSYNTSMGFSPLSGVPMGTRSGDIDPTVISFIMEQKNISFSEALNILNKQSGLLGVSQVSNDLRDIYMEIDKGNKLAKIARRLQVKRVVDYIAMYINELKSIDALVFTAGVGENDSIFREEVVHNLSSFGIEIDANTNKSNELLISTKDSSIKVLVIPTDEEYMMLSKAKESRLVYGS